MTAAEIYDTVDGEVADDLARAVVMLERSESADAWVEPAVSRIETLGAEPLATLYRFATDYTPDLRVGEFTDTLLRIAADGQMLLTSSGVPGSLSVVDDGVVKDTVSPIGASNDVS